nr:MAG TPA: hypothetical protein [Bacteriophage sp.]
MKSRISNLFLNMRLLLRIFFNTLCSLKKLIL